MLFEVFKGKNPTGSLVLFQVKGHATSFTDPVTIQVPVKTLLYAEMFGNPFFLLNVSVEDEVIYYVWLQKYIKTRLHIDSPIWRKQEKVLIRFPDENLLDGDGIERITLLAGQYSVRNLGLQFLHHSSWVKRHLQEFLDDVFGNAKHTDSLAAAAQHVAAISELHGFWDYYAEFSSELDLDKMTIALQKAASYAEYQADDEEREFFDTQCRELSNIQLLFMSGDEIDAFAVENAGDYVPY